MTKPAPVGPTQRVALPELRILRSKRAFGIALGLAAIAAAGVLRIGTHEKPGLRIRYIPVTQKIASGRVLVKPLDRVEYRIVILPEMRNAQVIGSFTAYGGPTNTVLAALMPSTEYASWITGHDAKAYYSTDGQKNTDQFAVRLDSGSYSFAISNRLSKKAAKFVYLEVQLVYDKAEAY
jgi:hypothetical protein